MELGEKVRLLRQKQKISIDQLSEMTGLSKGLISQIERDLTGPSVASLWKISKALNVTMNMKILIKLLEKMKEKKY